MGKKKKNLQVLDESLLRLCHYVSQQSEARVQKQGTESGSVLSNICAFNKHGLRRRK